MAELKLCYMRGSLKNMTLPKSKNVALQSIRREVKDEVTEVELAWLAGIVDGEGNFYIGKKIAENGKGYLDVKVRISSTDVRMIKRISEIYSKLNLRFHFARVNENRGTWNPAISINIGTHGSVDKLLNLITPYLVNRKELAVILIKIVKFVMAFPKGGNTSSYNYWDTLEMKRLFDEYRNEKEWYFDPSTTTRKANSVFEFGDIVWTCGRSQDGFLTEATPQCG